MVIDFWSIENMVGMMPREILLRVGGNPQKSGDPHKFKKPWTMGFYHRMIRKWQPSERKKHNFVHCAECMHFAQYSRIKNNAMRKKYDNSVLKLNVIKNLN